MKMSRRRKATFAIFFVILVMICRGIGKPPDANSPGKAVGSAASARDSTRGGVVPVVRKVDSTSRLPHILAFDTLPEPARTALRSEARTFRRYRLDEYDQKIRSAYLLSADDGLLVVRANLQGGAGTDYVIAGRNGGRRSVMAVMRRTDGGWTVQNVTAGEIGSRAPPDSASEWVKRVENGHPNGKWDAVLVKRLYKSEDAPEEVFYWDSERKVFVQRKSSR